MTDQQIDKVIQYLASEQQLPEDIAKSVDNGIPLAALFKAQQDNPGIYATQLRAEEAIHDLEDQLASAAGDDEEVERITAFIESKEKQKQAAVDRLQAIADDFVAAADNGNGDEILYGELLFNNPAAGGAYGCARCHSAGYSYKANDFPDNPLIDPIINGGGGLGPSLVGVLDQFETAEEQAGFIASGSKNGIAYGAYGQGDGGGGMPGFQACWAEDNVILPRIQTDRITGHCDGTSQTALNAHDGEVVPRDGILTEEQILAIVAYERSLDS